MRRAGVQPVLGPVVAGLAGLAGGVPAGWLGGQAALGIFGPFEVVDPWSVFGNGVAVLLPIMVLAAGMATGFVAGAVILPGLLMFGLGWGEAGKTVLFLLLLLLPVAPLTLWIIVEVGSRSSPEDPGVALLWVGAVVVGGLTPAAARILATRRHRGSSLSES